MSAFGCIRRIILMLFLALILLSLQQNTAAAQSSATVSEGSETPVASESAAITITVQPKNGLASVRQQSGGKFEILYKGNAVNGSGTDTLSYTVTGSTTPKVVNITIEDAPPNLDAADFGATFKALLLLFTLAVVLESALAVIFNWRPFVETLNARAVRPLIAVAVAYIVVSSFGLDLVASIITAMREGQGSVVSGPVTQIITALIIAGGSAGVNSILVALGYREIKTPETAPKPPPEKAWLAVKAKRRKAVGPIEVLVGTPPAPVGGMDLPVAELVKTLPIMGTIQGGVARVRALSYFFADKGRLPTYGGHEVTPGTIYTVLLVGRDEHQKVVTSDPWGPRSFAKGAIVDLELEI